MTSQSPSSSIGSWAVQRGKGRPTVYLAADKGRLPSVTTVTGSRFYGKEGLVIWNYNNGYEDGKLGLSPDPRRAMQAAADAGTLAHSLVENSIHGLDPWTTIPKGIDAVMEAQAQSGYEAFVDWSKVMHVNYVVTEEPMVSEKHRYGGTPDAIGHVNGKLSLWDWKTGNRIYGDHIIQLAAYRQLWNENHPNEPIQSCYVLRFGKEHGDFHMHSYPDEVLHLGWDAFLHLLTMYDLDKKLKKVAS